MTISQIQELHALGELNTVDKKIEALAILENKTIDTIEEMPMDDILKRLSAINFIPTDTTPKFKFKHNGKRYMLISNPLELKAHQWIELQEIFNGDIIESLDKIMALLSYEVNIFNGRKRENVTNFERKVTDFASLNFGLAYNYAVFFSQVYPILLESTLSYLKEEMEKLNKEVSNLQV
jgi:hypothetical protein